MQTDEMRLRFSGIKVRFRLYTPDDPQITTRVLFVSGPLSDAECWDKLCRSLAQNGILCAAAELPGFGKCPSSEKTPQSNDKRAAILWGILDEIEVIRGEDLSKWHVVAHGSACGAILEMTAQHPDYVLSRVLISPVFRAFSGSFKKKLLLSRPGYKLLQRIVGFYSSTSMFEKKIKALYSGNPGKKRVGALRKEFIYGDRAAALQRLIAEGYEISDAALTKEGPMMLIWGKNDRIFGKTPDMSYVDRLPDTEVHMISAGHMSMETKPDMIADYLRGWLKFSEGRVSTPFKRKKRKES